MAQTLVKAERELVRLGADDNAGELGPNPVLAAVRELLRDAGVRR